MIRSAPAADPAWRSTNDHISVPPRGLKPTAQETPYRIDRSNAAHNAMAWLYQHLLLFLSLLGVLSTALKFDLQALPSGAARPRCIRNFVARDTLVVVTATISGSKGDGQRVNIHVYMPVTRYYN